MQPKNGHRPACRWATVDATGARVSESGYEGFYNPVWNLVLHTMLPSMRSAVALATALPRHLPSFNFFLKTQTG